MGTFVDNIKKAIADNGETVGQPHANIVDGADSYVFKLSVCDQL